VSDADPIADLRRERDVAWAAERVALAKAEWHSARADAAEARAARLRAALENTVAAMEAIAQDEAGDFTDGDCWRLWNAALEQANSAFEQEPADGQ
jgi:hypothetical protein